MESAKRNFQVDSSDVAQASAVINIKNTVSITVSEGGYKYGELKSNKSYVSFYGQTSVSLTFLFKITA